MPTGNLADFAINQEPRCPVVLLLDNSGSMSGQPIQQLNQGVAVFKQFVDDILTPVLPIDRLENHDILLDELELMYDAHMTIGGEQNRFNASVIRAAINVIKSIQ